MSGMADIRRSRNVPAKRGMRVVVDGTPVMFDHGQAPAPMDVAVHRA